MSLLQGVVAPVTCTAPSARTNMNKRETIDLIMQRNRTARPEFLVQFSSEELLAYLRQLQNVNRMPAAGEGPIQRPGSQRSNWSDLARC
jgi:hypothetical protein